MLVVAGLFCLWLPRRPGAKIAAVALLVLAAFTPRVLQLLAPKGHFHSLTLTGYAVLIAGAVMIIHRAGRTLTRNAVDRRVRGPACGLRDAVQLDLDGELPEHARPLRDADAGAGARQVDPGRAVGRQEE